MSASYDETLPTPKDEARYLLGDTVVDPPEDALRSDELINAVLSRKGFELGLAFIADGLVAEIGQEPVKITLGGLAVDYSARIPAWKDLASRMRAVAAAAAAAFSNQLTGGVIGLDFQEDLGADEELD
jgi:hypothetical protein